LSANSSISSTDTYVVVDLTIANNTSITLPKPAYNPVTKTSSSTLTVGPSTQTFHVEAGYDSSGGLVMNFWPTGTVVDPINSDGNPLGFIRFAAGQIIAFDQNGSPLQIPSLQGIPTTWPLSLLGSNPGPSVISNLVVSNIQSYASARSAALAYGTPSSTAYVTYPTTQSGTAKYTYAQSGSNWVAQQLVLTPAISNGSSTRTIQFANLSWHDNATNDSNRASKGYTAKKPPSSYANIPAVTTSAPTGSTTASHLGGPQNVVFMHGLFSSGNTWNRMEPWLNQDFRFGTEITPSYGTLTSSLSSQGSQLVSDINSNGGSGYILVGHSQGGLISRYAAQQYQTGSPTQTTVKGVVTVDTPHLGAAIIQNGPLISPGLQALGLFLWDWTGCQTEWDNFVCFLAFVVYEVGPPMGAVFGALPLSPDINDLVPGSNFLTQLNKYSEKFAQAAVVGNTPQRWSESRVAWDFLAPFIYPPYFCDPNFYPESGCGERAVATGVGITYDIVEALLIFSIFEQIFDPYDDYFAQIEYYAGILVGMDGVDALWNLIVSGYSGSDAIVQSSSQNYPYTSAIQYPISGADSHLESTHSPYDHSALYHVLSSSPFLAPTQASCTFGTSPSTFSISATGGTGTFGLNTGTGCQWSAVSNAPWLAITSGSSGTSSGNVSFSVAANPVTIPRTGAILAGNGSTTGTFTVTQVGVCTYSLSEGPIVAIPPSGETNTVTVTTQSGCVWSAVSNASWLTITAGVSGTGTGSFTYRAAPNSGTADLSGTITVMSQTLTVVVGSPVGTPGTGTVTIKGGDQSVTINECPTNPYGTCWVTIWEGGNVSVTIGTETFSTGYGGTTTGAQIASALAGLMNYPLSPISATVSGAVISIRSTINGAATNYSLSTSYNYDTTDFSYPAFTAAASGTQLTGGTD